MVLSYGSKDTNLPSMGVWNFIIMITELLSRWLYSLTIYVNYIWV